MHRFLVVVLALALLATGSALAGRGDPQKRIVAADQVRAKAMVLRKADLPAFTAVSATGDGGDLYCKALDESDLTITGEARSPDFQAGVSFVSSLARVYRTRADADTSWRRAASAAGRKCARETFVAEFEKRGGRLVSFRRIAFPRVAERTTAYRLVVTVQEIRIVVDAIGLKQSRAQAALVFGSALAPFPKSEETRLARTVAKRMKTALRGT